jgi:hypothetical protein
MYILQNNATLAQIGINTTFLITSIQTVYIFIE